MFSHSNGLSQQAQQVLGPDWELLLQAGQHASKLGYRAYAIGGIPRDLLLNRPIRDLDITIEGDAAAVAASLQKTLGGKVQVHAPFLTATWTPEQGSSVDLASTRAEVYSTPGDLPTVTPAPLSLDLQRRDFTINTLAMSLSPTEAGSLKASPKALEDLENGVIRALHEQSFVDDPTRIFRAARFAARLSYTLHPTTQDRLQDSIESGCIQTLGRERLGNELQRLFQEAQAGASLHKLAEWGALGAIHTEAQIDLSSLHEATERLQETLKHHEESGWTHATQTDPWWILLGEFFPRPVRIETRRLVPGNRHQQSAWVDGPAEVVHLREQLDQAASPSEAGGPLSNSTEPVRVYAWAHASKTGRSWLKWWATQGAQQKTEVNGQMLLSRGFPASPAIGQALEAAQHACWNGESKDQQLLAAISMIESS